MTTTINLTLDSKLSDLMRLSRNKAGKEQLTAKIARGREQMGALGTAVTQLRAALKRLTGPETITRAWSLNEKVTARSQLLNLTYDEGAPENDDRNKLLASLPQFSQMSAGTIRINTVAVAIDPAVDTLSDVLTRINAAGAGVTATIDPSDDRLEITANATKQPILVEDGGTSFFSSLKLAPRAYGPPKASITEFGDTGRLVREVAGVVEAINGILKGNFSDLDADTVSQLKTGLKEALIKGLGGSVTDGTAKRIRSKYGFEVDFTDFNDEKVAFAAKKFAAAALDDYEGVVAFLAGGESSLPATVLSAFDDTLGALVNTIGTKFAQGVLVDLKG